MDAQHLEMGERLRECRKRQALTMQEVADRAGLSVGFISQVERGLTGPSLSSLASIAKVLDAPVSSFLEQPAGPVELTRRQERTSYSAGKTLVSYERLSAAFSGHQLRSVLMHEEPGYRAEAISHQGEELMFVMNGAITVELGGEQTVLRAGDSIHFDSRRPHRSWNHTAEVATLLWCGTMNVFGDGEQAPDPIHKKKKA